MRKSLLALLLAVAVTAGGLVAVAVAASRTIRVGDNWFVSASGSHRATVERGTTVVWRNVGRAPHDVTATRGPVRFRSSIVRRGGRYTRRMTRRGTYRIVCTIHAGTQRMTLVVR